MGGREAGRRLAVAAVLAAMLAVPVGRSPLTAVAASPTSPSSTSATSLHLGNWKDMTAIWMASHLCQDDTNTRYGPRIAELHYSGSWTPNQIVDYSGFFRNDSSGVKYDQINNFASSAWIDSSGALDANYLTYAGGSVPVQVQRNAVMPPNQPFMVIDYRLTNPGGLAVAWNLLDQVHLNNLNPSQSVQASYDSTRRALIANMTASGQFYVALGAFQAPGTYQAGNDADSNPSDGAAGAWYQFDANDHLADNGSLSASDVDMAFQNQVTIPAGGSADLYYYLTVRSTLSDVQQAASAAIAQGGAYWFSNTASQVSQWLAGGSSVSTSDSGVNTEYTRALLAIKNAQNPTLGTFPAATNPFAYGYKNWARDSSFIALALDASGHHPEAASYWLWVAGRQNSDGTFSTNWSSWDGSPVTNSVSPEYDSLGHFLNGVWRHYQMTGDSAFLATVWPKVQLSASWLMDNINSLGFVPADASIWEENDEYNVWTQGWSVVGLYAAERIAQVEGSQSLMDQWNGAAGTVLSAIQRSDTASSPGPGLWNAGAGTYDRAVETNNTPRQLLDSSSDMLTAFGAVDYQSSRAASHVSAVVANLSSDTYGVARYQGDTYYDTSAFDPCGNEANGTQPPWPQMTNWVGLFRLYTGSSAETLSRLQWDVQTSGAGYMPQGEAVSQGTFTPIVSTMVEPGTAASFVVSALAYTGQLQVLFTPPEYNAGDLQTINVTTNPHGDLGQWQQVPYFLKRTTSTPGGSQMAAVRRVFVTNDGSSLYLRVDNMSGALSGYQTQPLWGVTVYSEDFDHAGGATSANALYGRALDRPAAYLLARWSNSNNFAAFVPNGSGGWTFSHDVTSVIAPQWDPTTGAVEVVVPIKEVASSGSAGSGSWAYLDMGFLYQNPGTGTWYDNDYLQVHVRITGSGTAPIYGNVQ